MIPLDYKRKVFADARVTGYSVDFEAISYQITLTNTVVETYDEMFNVGDLILTHNLIPNSNSEILTSWMNFASLRLLEKSWRDEEENCYFQKIEDTYTAMMTLGGGYVVLIPLPMDDFFKHFNPARYR